MQYEYKAIGAPEKGRRRRGAKTRSDKVAAAVEDLLVREGSEGWEYLRTDLFPVEERRGWLGRSREYHRAVMVFRREVIEEIGDTSGDAASVRMVAERADAGKTTAPVIRIDTDQDREAAYPADPEQRMKHIAPTEGQATPKRLFEPRAPSVDQPVPEPQKRKVAAD